MWKVRELAAQVTNVVMNYTEIESRVREATNDDPWGPTGTIKHELSQATYSYDQFPEVMGMLWKRIAENKRSPRRIYKSLLLLHHLLLHGSDRVVRAAQDRLYEIRSLQDYHIVYEPGFNLDAIIPPSGAESKDGELNVRVKAKELVALIEDDEKLRDERKKARKNRDKYVGISSDRMMTSKWDNNDYGGGYADDDFGSKKSRSRSPSPNRDHSGFKPYSDNDSPDFKKSSSSNSFNNNQFNSSSSGGISFKSKPAPPSPSFEVTDDFNPRASEEKKASIDFGDFASAPTPIAKKTSASLTSAVATTEGGDFADFQSAFGANEQKSEPSKGDDLLGLSMEPSSTAANASSSFLTDDLFSAPSVANPLPSTFPAFGGPVSSVVPPSLSSPVRMPAFSPNSAFAPIVPSSSQNFGQDLMTPVMEPAKSGAPNGSAVNINNNSNAANNLKGTTWSDLNIKLDDLNLGRSNTNKSSSGNKTPMNQLRTTNGPNNSLGGLI